MVRSAISRDLDSARTPQVQRTVLLWAAVTMVLWAALPMTMYLSHWQWFGWMPRVGGPPPLPQPPMHDGPGAHSNGHLGGPPNMMLSMASLLVMSSVLMAVVLWMRSVRVRSSRLG